MPNNNPYGLSADQLSQVQTASKMVDEAIGDPGSTTRGGGFDIQEFLASSGIGDQGLLKPSLYQVRIVPPQSMKLKFQDTFDAEKAIPYLCDSASLPSIILTTDDTTKRQGIGPNERYVHNAFFTDVTFSFLGDGAGNIYKFFFNWMNDIAGFGGYDSFSQGSPIAGSTTTRTPYTIRYKDDIVAKDMIVILYHDSGEPTLVIKFNQVFPYIMAEVPVNWGSTDEIMRFPVTFTYRDWSLEDPTSIEWGYNPQSQDANKSFAGSITGAVYDIARGVNSINNTVSAVNSIASVFKF